MSSDDPADAVSEQFNVDMTDTLNLEPLRDHNYTSPGQSQSRTEDTATIKTKRKLKKLPKSTKIMPLYKCKECSYSTLKKTVYEAHRATHRKRKPNTKYKPRNSVKVDESTMPDHCQCPQCSFTTKSTSSLKIHMRVHTLGTSYKCSECDYNGKDIKDLVNHYKTAKNFCDYCTFSCHLKKKLMAHQKLHESQGKSKGLTGRNLVAANNFVV